MRTSSSASRADRDRCDSTVIRSIAPEETW